MKEEWAIYAKKALKFFVYRMGDKKWVERRAKVVLYFREAEDIQFGFKKIENSAEKKVVIPIAVYDDWIAWYMYLVESIFERPTSGDALQSARIFPFFSMKRKISLMQSSLNLQLQIYIVKMVGKYVLYLKVLFINLRIYKLEKMESNIGLNVKGCKKYQSIQKVKD